MNNVKKQIVIGIVVSGIVLAMGVLLANGTIEQWLHPNQTKVAGMWVDDEAIARYDFGGGRKAITAEINGDTYCDNCDKYIEGRVRICTFCGQYIND